MAAPDFFVLFDSVAAAPADDFSAAAPVVFFVEVFFGEDDFFARVADFAFVLREPSAVAGSVAGASADGEGSAVADAVPVASAAVSPGLAGAAASPALAGAAASPTLAGAAASTTASFAFDRLDRADVVPDDDVFVAGVPVAGVPVVGVPVVGVPVVGVPVDGAAAAGVPSASPVAVVSD